MSEFDDFMDAAFTTAASIIGEDEFRIAGVAAVFYGILDRNAAGEVLAEDGGGVIAQYDATIVAQRSQFCAKPKNQAELTCDGVTYMIEHVDSDTISYTLKLRQPVTG